MPDPSASTSAPTGQRSDHEVFALGDVLLQSGVTLQDARLAYKTYGTLADDRSNAIVHPTWYGTGRTSG